MPSENNSAQVQTGKPPKDAQYASIETITIVRSGQLTRITITGYLTNTAMHLIIYQDGTRHHLVYFLTDIQEGIGGDQMVPFSHTVTFGPLEDGATLVDAGGTIDFKTNRPA